MKASVLISFVSTLAVTALAASCDTSNAIDVTPYLEDLSKSTGGGGSLIDDDYFYRIIDSAVKRRVKRDTLDCKGSETCVALQGFPLCFDAIAYTWRDAAGDSGNLKDGSYTLSDGRKGNLYNGPYPLPDGSTATPTNNSSGGKTEAPESSPTTGGSSPDDTMSPDPTDTGSSNKGSQTTGAPSPSQTPNRGSKVGTNMVLAVAGGALAAFL